MQKREFFNDFCRKFGKISSSKFFIAAIFFILGACGTKLMKASPNEQQKLNKKQEKALEAWSESFDQMIEAHNNLIKETFESDPFFNHDSVFHSIDRMDREMDEMIKKHHQYMTKIFSGVESDQSSDSEMRSVHHNVKEDKDYYICELNFSGFDKNKIVVSVKDGILNFSSSVEEKSEGDKLKSYSSSNFSYAVSIPKYDEKTAPEIVRESGKITVKLKKISNEKKGEKTKS